MRYLVGWFLWCAQTSPPSFFREQAFDDNLRAGRERRRLRGGAAAATGCGRRARGGRRNGGGAYAGGGSPARWRAAWA